MTESDLARAYLRRSRQASAGVIPLVGAALAAPWLVPDASFAALVFLGCFGVALGIAVGAVVYVYSGFRKLGERTPPAAVAPLAVVSGGGLLFLVLAWSRAVG